MTNPSGNNIYTCPMHPEVHKAGPGNCPKCGMALELATLEARATEVGAREVAAVKSHGLKLRLQEIGLRKQAVLEGHALQAGGLYDEMRGAVYVQVKMNVAPRAGGALSTQTRPP